MAMKAGARREDREFLRMLSDRIWAWDPIGVAGIGAPNDEYDCLVAPVSGWLKEGLAASAIAERLDRLMRARTSA